MKERLEQWRTILEWRLEARRTGDDFAAVARRRSLIYQVEQLFLLNRQTNRWLLHVAADPALADDSALVERTLADIQRLARDYFFTGSESGVQQFQLRGAQVWIAPGAHSLLAAVIGGDPPAEMRGVLEDAIARIEVRDAETVANFHSDSAALEAAGRELTACLRSEHKPIPEAPRLRRLRVPGAAAAVVLVTIGLLDLRNHVRWREFLARLKSEPGILVATAERNRFTRSRVEGLRDPLAKDPTVIASEAKVDPARVRFDWKEYSAGDLPVVQQPVHEQFAQAPGVTATLPPTTSTTAEPDGPLDRFKAAFPLPRTVEASVVDSMLVLSGAAPYEWVAAVQEGATRIPGISAIKGDDLIVEFDPDLVLRRFRDEFGIPETIEATLRKGRLILSGEAPHAWLDRVRRDALRVQGIRMVDDRKVENIDQRDFQQAKAAVEDAGIQFVLNRDRLLADAEAELRRVAAEAQRCFAAAENMGVNVSLEVRAYGDAIATEDENAALSKRRAEAVRNFFSAHGLDETKITPAAMGMPPPPEPGEKSGAGKFDRRVFFRVAIQP